MNVQASLQDVRVAVIGSGRSDYEGDAEARVWLALNRASKELGWFEEGRGPFARIVPQGSRVVIKPNLVTHENQAGCGLEPLITHKSFIHCAVRGCCLAGARQVVVGDAPIKGCCFPTLLEASGLGAWLQRAKAEFPAFTEICDFRRSSWLNGEAGNGHRNTEQREPFALFDLGTASMLEPVTEAHSRFCVTCYDPEVIRRAHVPGRHQYPVALKVLDADVVINLPKLKMHKKAGVTCALKNLVGACSDKAYLPHHRAGGTLRGGDCYPGASRLKAIMEYATEHHNISSSSFASGMWRQVSRADAALVRALGDEIGIEGSWSGNDTVWRMCLDLNRILLYGRADGTMADLPQRRFIHLVDAVIAGQGEGPLAPEPLPLGLMLLAQNAAAADWVGALLLGYDAGRIPLVRDAFTVPRLKLATFASSDVWVVGDLGTGRADEALASAPLLQPTRYPAGWRQLAVSGRSTSTHGAVNRQ